MTTKRQNIAPTDDALIKRLLTAFEQARKVDNEGNEFWDAREFQEILGYSTWQRFENVIDRAKSALLHEGGVISDHFNNVVKVITAGKGAKHVREDIRLSRRACYLIGINGDPSKLSAVAAIQKYFVEQTRKQEISEILDLAGADAERVAVCNKLCETEDKLKAETASRLTEPKTQFDQVKRKGQKALFNKSPDLVREGFGIPQDREIADFVDPVIVKGMDFATSLTLKEVQGDPTLTGVRKISAANATHHERARGMMTAIGVFPENTSPVGDVREVQARLEKQRAKLTARTSTEQ